MRICLFLTVGRNIFGLGLGFEWLEDEWVFELQLGPLNVWGGQACCCCVSLLGRRIYARS